MGPSIAPVLPIHAHEEAIVATIKANPVVVVIAETGSGKTTQIAKVQGHASVHLSSTPTDAAQRWPDTRRHDWRHPTTPCGAC